MILFEYFQELGSLVQRRLNSYGINLPQREMLVQEAFSENVALELVEMFVLAWRFNFVGS